MIRIPIQLQDLYTLLYENIVYVEGRLTSKEKDKQKYQRKTEIAIPWKYLTFDEIQCELLSDAFYFDEKLIMIRVKGGDQGIM